MSVQNLVSLVFAITLSIPVVVTANLTAPIEPSTGVITKMRVFEEPLVPIGGKPSVQENTALMSALQSYSQRKGPDDYSGMTRFLAQHPKSPWRAALLTGVGLEYYKSARYSRALAAWEEAWEIAKQATDTEGRFLADRALCELAGLYSRLGRMNELEALLSSLKGRLLLGGAVERINLASEALDLMQHRPEISFRCGPLALLSIQRSLGPVEAIDATPIIQSASTHQGFSLTQVAELSRAVGLNYQMAFREKKGDFVIPSVVHWKVDHYAALVRQVCDRYLLEDPTFGNTVWATREALEAETSGYFLIPAGELPRGWREVAASEGGTVWGKGITSGIDPDNYTPEDAQGGICAEEGGVGMAISSVHLGVVSLQIRDTPAGYRPPVGPTVRFSVRYNQRDYRLPPSQVSRLFGPRWTHDWEAYIADDPLNPLADVRFLVGGGGARTFTGFDTNNLTFAPQQMEQTRLRRTGSSSYEMVFPNGSRKLFGYRLGSKVYLTQVQDSAGNSVTLTWSFDRLVALTDAIGQVTTISYDHPTVPDLISKVTDPFGRFASFEYQTYQVPLDADLNPLTPPEDVPVTTLVKITDVIGLDSQFSYAVVPGPQDSYDLALISMTTPYGTTTFDKSQGGGPGNTSRFVETTYPDGSRDRVEYNQNTNNIAFSDPAAIVPQGMNVFNQWLYARNTFYWDRNAMAQGAGDYSKARIYHWLHSPNISVTAGILESIKEPLERRVWFSYPGQVAPYLTVGSSDRPTRVGRVLDDGSTQLYSYAYNSLGHVTNSIDPVGREFTYAYATNGIDLVEIRQTRGTNDELVFSATYNHQHRPLTVTDAAGQTTINTYNSRGQLLTTTNPKGETTTFSYNANGYLLQVDGPLPGNADVRAFTYDAYGRVRTRTDESGFTVTFDYDPMGRLTRVTYPDTTFEQYIYNRLDLVSVQDSAGRLTTREFDKMRQMISQKDPLGRVTRFEWCSCGSLSSLTDPMGRMTEWSWDVQGRRAGKRYSDGSRISYLYENSTGRLRQMIDEKNQITHYIYNRDDSIRTMAHPNAAIPTPAAVYAYDPDYPRLASVIDGTGITSYAYHPITQSPGLGAGLLASIDGPLPDDTVTFTYDQLGRRQSTAINGVATALSYDAAGRITAETNALGSFTFGYEGGSRRLTSLTFPNNQTTELGYFGSLQDHELQRITHKVGATPVSEFIYGRNVPAGRVTSWSQQTGVLTPNLHSFGYDAVNQLLSMAISNGGPPANTHTYTYDLAGNRLTEQVSGSNYVATYNPLNQITTSTKPVTPRTNEWDALDRLVAVNAGNQRTELAYDAFSRLISIRLLTNGVEVSFRRLIWCNDALCEERDAAGMVTKRFFDQGIKVEVGLSMGAYFYTRDHLGSIRELIDTAGNIRARYMYDPWGLRTRISGDAEADFGFAGMFSPTEVRLNLTRFRAYDPALGRWLSQDPLRDAEILEGPNRYAYVANNPVNLVDPSGLGAGEMMPWSIGELAGGGGGGSGKIAGDLILRPVSQLDLWDNMRAMDWISEALEKGRIRGADRFDFTRTLYNARVRERWENGILTYEGYTRRVPDIKPAHMPEPLGALSRLSSGLFVVAEAGMTILEMTDCNTVEGIMSLVRQGKGGMANKYADRLYKQLQDEGL